LAAQTHEALLLDAAETVLAGHAAHELAPAAAA
jgi:hypothetical protein